MSDKKFIFKNNGNDDYLGIKCFQVDPNVEMKEIPTNGEEYLLKVMSERANYASIATCKLSNSEIYKQPTSSFREVGKTNLSNYVKLLHTT